jgi:hypothetical protein
MSELFKNVKPGQRCLFYAVKPGQSRDTAIKDTAMFTANVVRIVNGTTLNANNIVCKESCVYQTRGMLCMPLGWILKLEILDHITDNQLLIPSEIMLEIELFT